MIIFKILIKSGEKQNSVYLLGPEGLTIGRDPVNTLVLPDRRVSKEHCKIISSGEGFCIEDLGSVNGTQVNGRDVQKQMLSPGDTIAVGPTKLIFLLKESSDKHEDRPSGSQVLITEEETSGDTIKLRLPAKDRTKTFEDISSIDKPELQKAYQRLLILYRVSNQVGVITDLDKLFVQILELILEIINADRGFIMLAGEGSQYLIPRATCCRKGREDSSEITISKSIAMHVLKSGESVLTSDALQDSRFLSAQSVILQGIRSAMCVPLRVKDKILGIMHVDTKGSEVKFSQEDLELLGAIAHQAAIAIETALLVDSLIKANREIQQRQTQLIESEKLSALGRLSAGVAHEINNPMTSILGYSQLSGNLLAKEVLDDKQLEECRKFIKIVESEAIRCQGIVQTLLQFGRKKKQQVVSTDINKVIEDALLIAKFHIKHVTIDIQKELADNLPPIMADGNQLQQVFLNLIVNARDAMEQSGGVLKISTACVDGKWLEIKCSDTGCGIPEDKLNEIFKPLYTTKEEGKGTGLGLAITQEIVEMHGGIIDVASTVGKGSVFTIRLPIH